jgi:predicted dehydrogenase
MTADLGVALVGGGAIAKAHAAALGLVPFYFPDVPRLRPRVLCEANADLARAATERLGFEEGVVGWEDAVRRADVDVVIVATPPDLHHAVAIAALRAGKHVLCEKPLARTATEAAEMSAIADASRGLALVGFNLRYAPALLQARRLMEEGVCGDVYHLTGRYFQDFARDPNRPLSWRYQAARGGSGALADIGSHLLDAARALAGDIVSVSGVRRTMVAERPSADAGPAAKVDVDDYTAVLARFASGALGTFEVSRVATGRKNQLAIEINGSTGSIAFDWERSNELRYCSGQDPADRQGFRRIVAGPAFPAYPAPLPVSGVGVGFQETMVVQLAELARATLTGAPTATVATFRDGLRAAEIVDAVLASIERGGWVDIAPTRAARTLGRADAK